jgi:ketosteroid isomerase-like protein
VQLTSGQAFHHRLSAAIETQDLPALASFYHPDAVRVSLSTGQVFRGLGAILADIDQTLKVAGHVKPVAVDSFVEYGDIICVEATQATRFAQVQTYDIYVLQAGAIRQQFSGTISPRQHVTPQDPGTQTTPERQFHRRFCIAMQKPDLAELRALYRPDAVWIFASGGQVFPGRDAIVDSVRQSLRSGPPQLKALTRFIEAPDVICVEGIAAEKFSGLVLDVQYYEIFLLQAGAIRYRVNGMISPRPAEIAPVLQRQHDITISALQWAGQSFNPYPWRRFQ